MVTGAYRTRLDETATTAKARAVCDDRCGHNVSWRLHSCERSVWSQQALIAHGPEGAFRTSASRHLARTDCVEPRMACKAFDGGVPEEPSQLILAVSEQVQAIHSRLSNGLEDASDLSPQLDIVKQPV